MTHKDPSNRRIQKAVDELAKIMGKEKLGFLFAPMIQMCNNSYPALRISFSVPSGQDEISADELSSFWTTLVVIILGLQSRLPEKLREEFRSGFVAFVEETQDTCFPIIELVEKQEN